MAAATATSLLLLVSIRGLTAPANLPDLGREGFVLVFEIIASLLAGGLSLFLAAIGKVRLQHGPPAVVELGPFLPAKHGAGLGNVPVGDEGVL